MIPTQVLLQAVRISAERFSTAGALHSIYQGRTTQAKDVSILAEVNGCLLSQQHLAGCIAMTCPFSGKHGMQHSQATQQLQ